MNIKIKHSENSFTPHHFSPKSGEGFTLMEVLVYITVFSIIILTISSFTIWLIRSAVKARVMRETLDSARRAMKILTYEIREAESIYIPTTTLSQLSLQTAHYLPEGEETTYIDFYLCGKRLCLKKESQNPIALTSDKVEINNLEFSKVATTSAIPSVQILFRMDYKNPADRPEYRASVNLISTVSLR